MRNFIENFIPQVKKHVLSVGVYALVTLAVTHYGYRYEYSVNKELDNRIYIQQAIQSNYIEFQASLLNVIYSLGTSSDDKIVVKYLNIFKRPEFSKPEMAYDLYTELLAVAERDNNSLFAYDLERMYAEYELLSGTLRKKPV